MKKLLIVIILLFTTVIVYAKSIEKFIETDVAVVNENQTQEEVVDYLKKKLVRQATEKAGTLVYSDLKIENYNITKDEVTILASSISKVKIINTEPYFENKHLYIKLTVEVEVDKNSIKKALDSAHYKKDAEDWKNLATNLQNKLDDTNKELKVLQDYKDSQSNIVKYELNDKINLGVGLFVPMNTIIDKYEFIPKNDYKDYYDKYEFDVENESSIGLNLSLSYLHYIHEFISIGGEFQFGTTLDKGENTIGYQCKNNLMFYDIMLVSKIYLNDASNNLRYYIPVGYGYSFIQCKIKNDNPYYNSNYDETFSGTSFYIGGGIQYNNYLMFEIKYQNSSYNSDKGLGYISLQCILGFNI